MSNRDAPDLNMNPLTLSIPGDKLKFKEIKFFGRLHF